LAEIVDQLRLDIDQALADVNRIEQALDRALAPIEIEVDTRQTQELESTLREVERIASRAATETASIDLAAGRAEASFEDVARALNLSEEAARDLSTEILQAQAAANRLEDSARDVARQLGLSENETRRFANSLQTAARHADDIDTRGRTLVGTFGSLRTVIGGITGALAVIGGGQILGAATRGVQAALTQFQALNESINAVNVTFGSASQTVLDFGQISAQAAGLSAAAFQQAVVPIGSVLTNFGFSAREAADASVVLVQRAADLASVFNTDVSEALLSINSALVGQVEPLRRYGAEINQARVQQFALASGIIATKDEFDLQAQVAARVGLILQDTAKVQGDFANTSDELANAQRIAAAEVQEFAAQLGEQLAPAMAIIVGLLPDFLAGIQQLVPGLTAGADSAAAFFQSIGEGGGFRTEFANIKAGFDIATSGAGLFSSTAAAGLALLRGDLEGAGSAVTRFSGLLARGLTRPIAVDLARQLDAGTKATTAFGTAIQRTARLTTNFDVFTDSFRDFAIAADLTQEELFDVTGQLIKAGAAAGLSADEITFLETQYALLRNTLFVVGNEVDQAARAMAESDDTATRFTSTLERIQVAASDAGLSLADLLAGTDPLAASLLASLTPADQFALTLEGVRTGAITVADAFTSNLRPALVDVRAGLEDLNEDGSVSLQEFTANLATAAEDFLAFMVNIAAIAAISPELAAALRQLPEDVRNELAANFAQADPNVILEAAENLTGSPDDIADAILGIYVAGIGSVNGQDPKAVNAYLGFVRETFEADLPGITKIISASFQPALNASFADLDPPDLLPVIQASIEGMNAQAITASLDDALFASFADVEIPDLTGQVTDSIDGWSASEIAAAVKTRFEGIDFNIDFTDIGREARSTFFEGLSLESRDEAAQVRNSILNVLDTAIERDSPPKLFLRAGEDSGEAFWSGFSQAELTLKTAIPAITGNISSTVATGTTSAGVVVNNTINNPVAQDILTEAARLEQLTGASAAGLRALGLTV
jgi:hypothetical protein